MFAFSVVHKTVNKNQSFQGLGKGGLIRLSVLAFAACLAGCGGGGGGADEPSADAAQASAAGLTASGDSENAEVARLRMIPVSQAVAQAPMLASCDAVPQLPTSPGSVISVTDYGARADDEVDDAAAIQMAIHAAKSGQWVVFPAGRYIHSRSLQVTKPGITLWGQGATLHASNPADQSILLKADGARVYGFKLTAVTEGRRSEAVASRISAWGPEAANGYIRGIVIQNNSIVPANSAPGTPLSNGSSAAGILVVGVRDFTIAGNTVERSLSDGIHITSGSQNGRVLSNQVKETGDDMIAVVSYLDVNWRTKIKDSSTWLSAHQAKTMVKDILISRNIVSGQYWGRGISVVGGDGISILRNNVSATAMGAGILVAREESWRTHGVNNVWIEGNVISKVQTVAPSYVPVGSYFTDLIAKLAVNGGRTGQGGVEVHNISATSDINDATLYPAVKVTNVLVRDNSITDVIRDGIRVAADSPLGSVSGVALHANRIANARVAPLSAKFAGDSPAIVQCEGNTYSGAPTTLPWCVSLRSPQEVTGAALSCSAF